jgi:hypothetical protein
MQNCTSPGTSGTCDKFRIRLVLIRELATQVCNLRTSEGKYGTMALTVDASRISLTVGTC